MNRIACRVAAAALILAVMASPTCSLPSRAEGPGSRGPVAGADLSSAPLWIAAGAEYRVDGAPKALLRILKEHGFGLVRLRLWHTPAEHWHGLDSTVAFASEVKAAGLELMLDIHYSDTWADPAHQTKPAAWSGLAFPALVDSVYAYTNAVVRRFRDAGALPDYVQVGNEISGGMLWDDGRVGGAWDTPQQWGRLGQLIAAGAAGVRDSLPREQWPDIIVHVDNGADNALCRWFFDNLVAQGVEFDCIGVSFYPWWHGTLDELGANLVDLADRYGKKVMVVEAAYPWTLAWCDSTHNPIGLPGHLHGGYADSPAGQEAFLRDLLAIIDAVPGGAGSGPVYWEPAMICMGDDPGSSWENLALFDFEGKALPGLSFAAPPGASPPTLPSQD